MEAGWPQLTWASVASLSSSLPLSTSVPSSGCFLYLEPAKRASSGPLKRLHPLPVYFSPDALEAHRLFFFFFFLSLCSNVSLRMRTSWTSYTKLHPSFPPLSFYPPYYFIFSKRLSPSDIYSFYTFSLSSSIEINSTRAEILFCLLV